MDNKNRDLAISATSKIYEKVNKALGEKDSDIRWFWELLQNAKDTVVASKGKVDVRLVIVYNEVGEPIVRFEHNGSFFKYSNDETYKYDDPKCLLLADSGKSEEDETQREDVTGQFGTGFLSTHIISLKIFVEGIYLNRNNDFNSFSFLLDRKNHNIRKELVQKVQQSLDEYDKNFKPVEIPTEKDFHTKFTYFLKENKESLESGLDVVKKGIDGIDCFIPYVLAFCKEINSVEIIDSIISNNSVIFSRQNELQKQDNEVQIVQISKKVFDKEKNVSESKFVEIAVCSDSSEHIDLAIEIQKHENSYRIIPVENNLPVLFCTFPLIGSERWRFPVALNCTKFHPRTERDGILLLTGKDNGNQNRIENALKPYSTLLDFAINQNWDNLYWLAKTDYDICPTWTSEAWYKGVFETIRQHLLTKKIVTSQNSNQLFLKDALFPSYPQKEKLDLFWDICYEFIPSQIPQKKDIVIWNEIINQDYCTWQTNLRYDLETLLKDIEKEITLAQLAQNKFENDENRAIKWLNKVIEFVFNQAECPEILKAIAIIPNQIGTFSMMDKLITDKDKEIPEQLKDVLFELSEDNWRKVLMNSFIQCRLPDTQKKGVEEISAAINKIIEDNKNPLLVREAVYKIISFYSSEFDEKENSETWRRTVWQIAKDLDNSVPEIQEVVGLIPNLWKKADEWLFETLAKDIQAEKNTENLQIKLKKETKEQAVIWLNDNFIQFYETKQKSTHYSDKAIFPNQEGLFKKQKDNLHFDKIKHKEFKEILYSLGTNWYALLLDENITAIKNFEQQGPLCISDISTSINKIIKSEHTVKNDNFKNAIYRLVCILPDDSLSERKRLLGFSHQIFPDKVASIATILPNITDFDFYPCNEWVLTSLMEELRDIKNINSLKNYNKKFLSKTEDELFKWVDNFISFVSSFEKDKFKPLLDRFSIIPNQNDDFCLLKSLKKDNNIPYELKVIAKCKKIDYDWNAELLHKSLTQTGFLFDDSNTISLINLATQINGCIRDYDGNKQNKDFAELVFLLNQSKIVNSENKATSKLFSDFHSKRDSLIVGTLGEGEGLSNVAKLIQNPEKLSILASIAENNDISTKQLEYIAEITQIVQMSKIVELVQKEEKKEKDKIFHTNLGTTVEQIFKNIDIDGIKIERKEIGQDYDLTNLVNGLNIHLEIKSISVREDFVKMTKWQGKKASLNSDNYVLCVLPKDTSIMTEQYFLEHAKFVVNIGQLLENKVREANEFEQHNFESAREDIRIDFEKEDYKFRIYKRIWENGLSWNEFKQTLKVPAEEMYSFA